MARDPAAAVELLARLDAIGVERCDDALRAAASRACARLLGAPEELSRAERWALALACIRQLAGESAASEPLVDEGGSEWSELLVEAAHETIEEVTNDRP